MDGCHRSRRFGLRGTGATASLFRVDLSSAVAQLTFEPLANRLANLPLVLAGPILRQTYPDSVTVWVALKEPRQVTLSVFAASDAGRTAVLTGMRSTVALGKSLHVVAVTASPPRAGGLVQDVVYGYEFDFGAGLGLKGATNNADLAYTPFYDFPSFSLAPADIADLHLIHGSCRKAHAGSLDAMPGAHLIIKKAITEGVRDEVSMARRRPHAMFLTGDQIYADDVADCLLDMLIDAGETLLGWGGTELLPGVTYDANPQAVAPGKRSSVVGDIAKLTAGIPKPEVPKSHLMTLAEFYAMYLFAWSYELWPPALSTLGSADEQTAVGDFKRTLGDVRKALANVPTYMICDDHDVTDDWFMNRQFCDQVLAAPLGCRIVQNALTAYAVFQAWGNTPEQFAELWPEGAPGCKLLAALATWKGGTGAEEVAAYKTLGERVGIPPPLSGAETLTRPAGALKWFYRVAPPNTKFEVLCFDCRTARRYQGSALLSPALLSPQAFTDQADQYPAVPDDGLTIAIVQTPFFGLPLVEDLQAKFTSAKDIFNWDCEAWGIQTHEFQRDAYQRFLATMAQRRQTVLILAGDVHYSFVARASYWADRPYRSAAKLASKRTALLVQLNASSFRNQAPPTLALTNVGWVGSPEKSDFVGWNDRMRYADLVEWLHDTTWVETLFPVPPLLNMSKKPSDAKIKIAQDWRYVVQFICARPFLPNPLSVMDLSQLFSATPGQALLSTHEYLVRARQLVGLNNIGELTFKWPQDPKARSVTQSIWWRKIPRSLNDDDFQPFSIFDVSLDPSSPVEPPSIVTPSSERGRAMSDDSKQNFQQALIQAVLDFLDPLLNSAQDVLPGEGLMEGLAWDLEAMQGGTLAALATELRAIAGLAADIRKWVDHPPTTLSDLPAALSDVKLVVDALTGLGPALAATSSLPAAAFSTLPQDILDYLAMSYVRSGSGLAHALLRLLGIVRPRDPAALAPLTGADGRLIRTVAFDETFDLNRLTQLLTDPVGALKADFGAHPLQDTASARRLANALFPLVTEICRAIGLHSFMGATALAEADFRPEGNTIRDLSLTIGYPGDGVAFGASIILSPADFGGLGVVVVPFGALQGQWQTGPWRLTLAADATIQAFAIGANGVRINRADNGAQFDGSITLERIPPDGASPSVLIGSATQTRLEVAGLSMTVQVALGPSRREFGFLVAANTAKLVIQAGDGDGFISSVMPKQPFELDFDLGIGWSSTKGLYFKGGAAIEVSIPVHETILDVVTLKSVDLSIRPDAGAINIAAALTGGLQLGPLLANVKKLGLSTAITFPPGGGNLGPLQVGQFGFKLPEGIGLLLDTAAVRGGGALQIQPDMYSGELQLCINQAINLTAIGLINTKLPDGAAGFALLILITAKFQPIQLGYGFTLNGVGGLAALNHSMNQQALSDGVRNHTLDSILFPTNPVANANKIISDLQRVFPVTQGRFVFAPMVEIGWGGSVLLIDVALVVDLPSPLRLTILGRMHLLLPPATDGAKDDAAKVVVINLDVQGSLDLDQDAISVDAQLYESRLALFPITGGMAMRIRWGAQPVFLFALGGFNPRFTPPPSFPPLDRVGIQMRYDKDGVRAGLCLTSYFAVTTNTLQFGARIDAYAEVSIAKLAGYLGFDALVDMVPFHVIVDLYGGVCVQAFGLKFSCDLLLTLAAFDPVTGDGHVTIDFLGKHEVPIHFSIGDAKPLPALPVADALHKLMNALADVVNWSAGVPAGAGMVVNLRPPTVAEITANAGKPLAHPLARLSVRQRVLPLRVVLQRFGAATPAQPGPFDIATLTLGSAAAAAPATTTALCDDFARGQFLVLSDDDKLCAPQFESFVCGYDGLGTEGARIGTPQTTEFDYDTRVIDDRAQPAQSLPGVVVSYDYMRRVGQFGATSTSAATRYAAPPKGIKVRAPTWKSVATDHLDAAPETFDTYTQAQAHRRAQPGAGKQQVVESFELA